MHTASSPQSGRGSPSARLLGGLVVALALLWAGVIGSAVYPALPYSVFRKPAARPVQPSIWAPQGWGFFTKEAREGRRSTVYARRSGEWESAMLAPHSNLRNVFGLNRASRAQAVEAALLASSLPRAAWRGCDDTVLDCLRSSAGGSVAARNPMPHPTLCGTVGIVVQRPVPWAWTRSRRPVHMPATLATADIEC